MAVIHAGWAGESLDSHDTFELGLPKVEWQKWEKEVKEAVADSFKECPFPRVLFGAASWRKLSQEVKDEAVSALLQASGMDHLIVVPHAYQNLKTKTKISKKQGEKLLLKECKTDFDGWPIVKTSEFVNIALEKVLVSGEIPKKKATWLLGFLDVTHAWSMPVAKKHAALTIRDLLPVFSQHRHMLAEYAD